MKLLMICILMFAVPVYAGVELYEFKTQEQEARYKKLVNELRCLVCQNQNLADSNAELAQDLRKQVYKMLLNSNDDEQIVDYMVERYGDFVLYRPPFKLSTAVLWIGPFVLLILGVIILLRILSRQKKIKVDELSPEDHEKARQLLNGKNKK